MKNKVLFWEMLLLNGVALLGAVAGALLVMQGILALENGFYVLLVLSMPLTSAIVIDLMLLKKH